MSKLLRYKCKTCNKVEEYDSADFCPKCGNKFVNSEGMVQIYRMGSPLGVAVGYGIYINGEPYGHLGNTETTRIPLAYGTYNFHFTCGMTRKCKDVSITLSPEKPKAYIKARIKMGFWTNTIIAEEVSESDMPLIK